MSDFVPTQIARRGQQLLLAALACAFATGGCGPRNEPPRTSSNKRVTTSVGGSASVPQPRDTAQEPITPTDACAFRLHDIAGQILLYYAVKRELPESLEQLRTVPGADASVTLICPVSNQPYIYTPEGPTIPNQPGRAIVFDPRPSHSGHHWAVLIAESDTEQPLITRIVAVQPSQVPAGVIRRR